MSHSPLTVDQARHQLYEVMKQDLSFEEKAKRALSIGEEYLGVENGHVARIDQESNYWKALASTGSSGSDFPPGLRLDLQETYCRHTIAEDEPIALHDAADQGWEDDPAFEAHELHCYHGTTITIDDEPYGTVCFVSAEPRQYPFSDDETMFAELIARMLEHELKRERTEAKLEQLDQFASVISHDLRNPLNVAQARIELEQAGHSEDNLAIAADALDRMETMIGDVLTMARQGQAVETTEPVSLHSIVNECWQSVRTDSASLELDADFRFNADPDRIRHLFENLLRNATDHGPDDVSIRIGPLAEADGFYVADDGPGIPAEDRDQVFDPGYSTDDGGTGIGLSIVTSVASAHDWTVSVTDSATGGARFEVSGVTVP